MTRKSYRYWLRFPGADTWRCWESDRDWNNVAREAAAELRCTLPITIEVRADQHARFEAFTVNPEDL